jgi:ankyrin repeat protein
LLQNHNTALHIACENGDVEAVGQLIMGAKVNGSLMELLESTNKEKETPFAIAERNQHKAQQ